MNPPKQCSTCGTVLPPDAPVGVCPKCLLRAGMDARAEASVDDATLITNPDLNANRPDQPATERNASHSPQGPSVGTTLRYFGDYELLDEIARGGMGVVYKARQVKLNRIVALKMILAGQFAGPADVQRFHTEAEAAAQLDHPGIVPIFEVGEYDGHHFFSMGLVKGESLARRIADGPLTPREAAETVRSISEAIQYAHGKGVIHRDLKPANILLDKDSLPRVTDFGLAKKVKSESQLTATGQILGTPSYMPPEQAAGRIDEIRESADIYSLGAILYATLTGRPPFQADNTLDTVMQVMEREPVSPRQLNASVPRDLETICLKCLEKDRRRRYATAQALADELGRFLNGETILARPAGTIERVAKWSRRRPASAALISVSVLATVLLLAGGAYFIERLAKERNDALNARNDAVQARNDETIQRGKAEQAAKDEATARAAAVTERNEATLQRNVAREQESLARESRDEAERQRATAQAERTAAQQNLVTSHFLLGKIANSDGDTAGALTWYLRAYRDAALDDPRRVSARNLIGAWGGSLKQTLVHDSGVHTVAVSADGRKLVAGYFNSRAQIWDLATGMPQGAPLPHAGDIVSAQLNADGSFALIGDWDGATVWDVATGKPRYPLLDHEVREDTVVGPVLSPDGRSIVTRSPFTGIRLWDVETGKPRGESLPLGKFVDQMIFSPDSKRVVALGGGVALVCDVEKAQPVGAAFTEASDLAFHPAGHVVAVCRNDGKLVVRDLDSGQQIAELAHDKPLRSVEFDAEGKNLVCRDDENAYLWVNVLQDERSRRVLSHGGGLFAAGFSREDGSLLTASALQLRVWKAGTATPLWERSVPSNLALRRSERIKSAAFSPDGKSLLTLTENDTAEVFSVSKGQMLVRELNVLPRAATFAADGRSFIAGSRDGWVRVRSVNASDDRRLPKALPSTICSGSTAALSPDGKLIFVVGREKSHICRTDTWQPVGSPLEGLYHDYKDAVAGAAFSPDNRVLVTSMSFRGKEIFGPSTGQIAFWDIATTSRIGETISVATTGPVAFDPTGRNARVGNSVLDLVMRSLRTFAPDRIPKGERTVTQLLHYSDSSAPLLWDDDRGGPTTVNVSDANAKQALLSPDCRRLLIVRNDGTARLHDAAAGTPLGPAFQPEGPARERSHNGRYTLFGTLTTLRLWDTWLGRPCGEPLQNEMANATASFGPGGTVVATHWSFTAHLWDCATGLALGPPMELSSNQISNPIFTADGRRLYIPSNGLEAWRVPLPSDDEPERLRLSIEIRTGLEINEKSTIQKLSQASWLDRKRRLEQLGGPCDVRE